MTIDDLTDDEKKWLHGAMCSFDEKPDEHAGIITALDDVLLFRDGIPKVYRADLDAVARDEDHEGWDYDPVADGPCMALATVLKFAAEHGFFSDAAVKQREEERLAWVQEARAYREARRSARPEAEPA